VVALQVVVAGLLWWRVESRSAVATVS